MGTGSRPGDAANPEIPRLAVAAVAGDRAATEALFGLYQPLLKATTAEVVRRGLPSGVGPDDVAQEAGRQFCELLRAYDLTGGVNLTTYLQRKLKWRVLNFLRAERRRASHAPLGASITERLADELARAPDEGLEDPRLGRALRRLSPRQRSVVAGLYWRDRTARELARDLGVTPQAVTALGRRAIESLRRDLAGRAPGSRAACGRDGCRPSRPDGSADSE